MSRPRMLLALDFDGVVAPLASYPMEGSLDRDFRNLLVKLLASPRLSLALISRRSLRDLEAKIGLRRVIYAGNHGMEIRGAGLISTDGLASSCRSDLVDVLAFLTRFTRRMPGVRIEDNGLSITAHWRVASAGDRRALEDLLSIVLHSHPRLQTFPGEMAWNIGGRASWEKSSAIHQMLEHLGLSCSDLVYLAEGSTDERTLERLSEGVAFRVVSAESGASVANGNVLASPMEVRQLLFCLLHALNNAPLG
jgi:trehalose-phosphatase